MWIKIKSFFLEPVRNLNKIKKMWKNLISNGLDLLFPKFCLGCQKDYNPPKAGSHSERSEEWEPGGYLCEDCIATLEISQHQFCLCKKPKLTQKGKCPSCQAKKLSGLYSALPYQNLLVKHLIQKFKYEPFIKELAKPLSSLIINHFQLVEKPLTDFSNFVLIPVPLHKKKLKWRGFNQAEEIGKELAKNMRSIQGSAEQNEAGSCFLSLKLLNNVLIKTKETLPQVELPDKEKEENIKGVFLVKNENKIKGRKILLVDDVYTTGSTVEECARILKEAGAKEVWGIVVARG